MTARDLPLVSFLVIGAQKAGTRTLRHYLSQHPAIGLSRSEEGHYFDDDEHFSCDQPTHESYHRRFPTPGHAWLYGEVTPIYLYWSSAMPRIRDYNPNMRLIAILRDPVARAYSAWNMERSRGREFLSFEKAIEQEQQRLKAEHNRQHRNFSYVDRGRYADQLERVLRYFPKRQLQLLRTEDLAQAAITMQKIATFLDIEPDPFLGLKPARLHVGAYQYSIDPCTHARLSSTFEPQIRRLETVLDWDLSDWRHNG